MTFTSDADVVIRNYYYLNYQIIRSATPLLANYTELQGNVWTCFDSPKTFFGIHIRTSVVLYLREFRFGLWYPARMMIQVNCQKGSHENPHDITLKQIIFFNSVVETAVSKFGSPECIIIQCCYFSVPYVCPVIYDHWSTCILWAYAASVNAVLIARHNCPFRSVRFASICLVFVNYDSCCPAP